MVLITLGTVQISLTCVKVHPWSIDRLQIYVYRLLIVIVIKAITIWIYQSSLGVLWLIFFIDYAVTPWFRDGVGFFPSRACLIDLSSKLVI